MQKRTRRRIFAFFMLCVGFFLFGWYWYNLSIGLIEKYQPARDRETVWRIFKENHYWLDVNPLSVFEDRLNQLELPEAVRPSPIRYLDVFRGNGVVKGFVIYQMDAPKVGRLLYLAVDKPYRRHGIAEKMFQYGIEQLRAKGADVVVLSTRVDNVRAQNLYKKFNFREVGRNTTFVDFALDLGLPGTNKSKVLSKIAT